jgi:hypothetical protein
MALPPLPHGRRRFGVDEKDFEETTMIRYLLLGTVLFVPCAFADTTLIFEDQRPDAAPTTTKLVIKDNLIGISEHTDTERLVAVFNRSDSSFTFIDHRHRQYTVMSEAWMADATQRAKAAMKRMEGQMQKQMENIPPQYRGMVQQGRMMMPMMAPMMSGASSPMPARTYMPYGMENIGGLSCRRIDVMESGKKVQQLCVTDAAALKIPSSDYGTFQAMLGVTERLANQGLSSFGFKTPTVTQSGSNTQGIPIIIRDLQTHSTATLQETSFDTVDADALQPPKDYLEAKIPLPVM